MDGGEEEDWRGVLRRRTHGLASGARDSGQRSRAPSALLWCLCRAFILAFLLELLPFPACVPQALTGSQDSTLGAGKESRKAFQARPRPRSSENVRKDYPSRSTVSAVSDSQKTRLEIKVGQSTFLQ